MKARLSLLLIVILFMLPTVSCGRGNRAAPTATPTPIPAEAAATAAEAVEPTAASTETPLPPTATPTPTDDGVVTATVLNVRTGPGLEFGVVSQLQEGAGVTVHGANSDRTWLQITSGDQEGWVSAEYIDLTIPPEDIPIVSTATPTPPPPTTAATAASEPGAEGTATSEEQAYLDQVRAIQDSYLEAMNTFMELGTAVQENPMLVFDSSWQTQVKDEIAGVTTIHQRVLALTPPPEAEVAHGHLVQASDHFHRAGQLVLEGLDELDPSKLVEAGEEVELGRQAAQQAAAEFDKLM